MRFPIDLDVGATVLPGLAICAEADVLDRRQTDDRIEDLQLHIPLLHRADDRAEPWVLERVRAQVNGGHVVTEHGERKRDEALRRTDIGDQVEERRVALVAYRAHDRRAAPGHGAK